MQLYVDSANLKDIKHAASLGILSGVTTNPSLLAKEDPSLNLNTIFLLKKYSININFSPSFQCIR